MANDQNAGYGTGRRKTAVARVRLQAGEGRITINEMPALKYLGRRTLELVVGLAFERTNAIEESSHKRDTA